MHEKLRLVSVERIKPVKYQKGSTTYVENPFTYLVMFEYHLKPGRAYTEDHKGRPTYEAEFDHAMLRLSVKVAFASARGRRIHEPRREDIGEAGRCIVAKALPDLKDTVAGLTSDAVVW